VSAENVELVRTAMLAAERGDLDASLSYAHPELVSRRIDPDGAVFHGPDGFREMFTEWSEGFDEWSFEGSEFIDAGDRVVMGLRQWARGAASGAPVEAEFWLVYSVRDGMIATLDIYADRRHAFEAAGLA
jgi:ketosteroid isomerase-like protein